MAHRRPLNLVRPVLGVAIATIAGGFQIPAHASLAATYNPIVEIKSCSCGSAAAVAAASPSAPDSPTASAAVTPTAVPPASSATVPRAAAGPAPVAHANRLGDLSAAEVNYPPLVSAIGGASIGRTLVVERSAVGVLPTRVGSIEPSQVETPLAALAGADVGTGRRYVVPQSVATARSVPPAKVVKSTYVPRQASSAGRTAASAPRVHKVALTRR